MHAHGSESSRTKTDPTCSADSLRRLLPAVLYRLGRTQVELKDWEAASATLDRLLDRIPEESISPRSAVSCALSVPSSAAMPRGFVRLLDPAERKTGGDRPEGLDPRRFD